MIILVSVLKYSYHYLYLLLKLMVLMIYFYKYYKFVIRNNYGHLNKAIIILKDLNYRRVNSGINNFSSHRAESASFPPGSETEI